MTAALNLPAERKPDWDGRCATLTNDVDGRILVTVWQAEFLNMRGEHSCQGMVNGYVLDGVSCIAATLDGVEVELPSVEELILRNGIDREAERFCGSEEPEGGE